MKTALLIEDDTKLSLALRLRLSHMNFNVHCVGDAIRAIYPAAMDLWLPIDCETTTKPCLSPSFSLQPASDQSLQNGPTRSPIHSFCKNHLMRRSCRTPWKRVPEL